MNELTGYLEWNGQIYKIKSIEDLHNFAKNLGEQFKEFSKENYQNLCAKNVFECEVDDCGVAYSKDGQILVSFSGAIEEYKIRQGTILIKDNAFQLRYGRKNEVTYIHFPDSVIAIGKCAFANNQELEEVGFSNNIHYIGEEAFSNCHKLKCFILPASLKYLGARAFQYCNNIKNIKLPTSIKNIGSQAFFNCQSLETISLSQSIEAIGSSVFEDCHNLKEIRIPKGTFDKFKEMLPTKTTLLKEVES